MAVELQYAHPSEPFRWKLFLLVVLIMGAITTAAIILTLMANPPRGTVRAPTTQPIAQIDLLPLEPQNPATVL